MAKSSPKHFFSRLASCQTPRSRFDMSHTNTTTIKTDYLYPVFCEEVLPGDSWNLSVSNFLRLVAPIDVPIMDNLYCDYHFWFVPMRLVWDYTKQFFGEKRRPEDPVDFTIPQISFDSTKSVPSNYNPEEDGFAGIAQPRSIYDYFELPVQSSTNRIKGSYTINALPLRCYNLIYDEWYRDEQRCEYSYYNVGNEVTTADKYHLLRRGKRFDYFTSSLLEPQIGEPVNIPLGATAPVAGNGMVLGLTNQNGAFYGLTSAYPNGAETRVFMGNNSEYGKRLSDAVGSGGSSLVNGHYGVTTDPKKSGLVADLSSASASNVATLRQAFQLQAYQEIMARTGTRYTEYIYGQFGVISPDARLQRPEFLGGTHQRITVQPVIQNSSSDNISPQGNLAAIVYSGNYEHGFVRSFTEHGYIIGIMNIYSDLTYFQGLDRKWSRITPLDFAIPIFANLTDQTIKNKEIYFQGNSDDNDVFGYAERYAEYKYSRNTLTGLVRPDIPLSIGQWSLAQNFGSLPLNNHEFIESDTPTDRIVAVPDQPAFIVNQSFEGNVVRALPAYSDPMKWFMRG